MLAHPATGKRPDPIIDFFQEAIKSTRMDCSVALQPKILDDLIWIKWQYNALSSQYYARD
jgi:hypothetical protein